MTLIAINVALRGAFAEWHVDYREEIRVCACTLLASARNVLL